MRRLTDLPFDEYQRAVDDLAQELASPPFRGQVITWAGEQFRLNRKAIANIRRVHDENEPAPLPSYSEMTCQYPHLFDTDACCICGDIEVSVCPCTSRDALVHLERMHPDHDSQLLRESLDCVLEGSDPAPDNPSGLQVGIFTAPCGDNISYMTTARFPTLAHYRWHAIHDHLSQGNCLDDDACDEALWSGQV